DCVTMEGSNTVVLKAPRTSQPNRQGDKSLPQTAQRFTFTQVPLTPLSSWIRKCFVLCCHVVVVFRCLVLRPVRRPFLRVQFVVWSRMFCREATVWWPDQNSGLLPRSLSVIFNSMEGRLYSRSDLKPQRCRDFSRLTPDQQAAEISSKRNLLRLLKEPSVSQFFSVDPSFPCARPALDPGEQFRGGGQHYFIVYSSMHKMLALCDLAGSERCSRTHNTGERLKEAGNINGSLLTLGKCINAMRLNQNAKYDPSLCLLLCYKLMLESKLTHFLQYFFCGSGRVSMVVNINQNSSCFDETLNVLKFSALAQKVVVVNSRPVVLDDSTCHKSAMELSLIIDEADQRRNMLNQGRRSSLVAWETSLEDVLEAEDSEEWKEEEEEEEDFMEGTVLEAGGEEEDGDRTMEDETEKVTLG
ncbi:hypothetical protein XENOCAPTIV_010609, partial [Xenoophorus captivus]